MIIYNVNIGWNNSKILSIVPTTIIMYSAVHSYVERLCLYIHVYVWSHYIYAFYTKVENISNCPIFKNEGKVLQNVMWQTYTSVHVKQRHYTRCQKYENKLVYILQKQKQKRK